MHPDRMHELDVPDDWLEGGRPHGRPQLRSRHLLVFWVCHIIYNIIYKYILYNTYIYIYNTIELYLYNIIDIYIYTYIITFIHIYIYIHTYII